MFVLREHHNVCYLQSVLECKNALKVSVYSASNAKIAGTCLLSMLVA